MAMEIAKLNVKPKYGTRKDPNVTLVMSQLDHIPLVN
jgi:hypothetical protein